MDDAYDFLRIYWTNLSNGQLSINAKVLPKMVDSDGTTYYSVDDAIIEKTGLALIPAP